ncbi:hypothetical protein CEP52_017827, partial [Fusarium oligoseptatum]
RVAYQALAPLVQLPAGSCDCLIRQHFHLCIKSCMTQRVLPLSSCSLDNSHQLTGAINDPCGANCLTKRLYALLPLISTPCTSLS